MQTGDFLRKVQGAFQEEIKEIQSALGTGHCSSIESYKGLCGEIKGLNRATDIIQETLKQLHEEDDDG